MNKEKKKQIEKLLRKYPQMKSRIRILKNIIKTDYSLRGVKYDTAKSGQTNEFYSDVEDHTEYKDKKRREMERLRLKKECIDDAMESLTPEEKKMIRERYFFDKTYDSLADGTYDTYRWRTIYDWIEDALEKMNNAGLKDIV